ncbi:MAG TPA: hypothetical protein VGR76_19275, partial [Candidatus Angelobacter sp.]|nr:hypothetical protein [Candidatus Angelobacter sp.]
MIEIFFFIAFSVVSYVALKNRRQAGCATSLPARHRRKIPACVLLGRGLGFARGGIITARQFRRGLWAFVANL